MRLPLVSWRRAGGAQAQPGTARRFSSTFGGWPGCCVLMVALYLLSVGPMVVFGSGLVGLRGLEVIYAPVFWLIERSETAEKLFFWYTTLWGMDWALLLR